MNALRKKEKCWVARLEKERRGTPEPFGSLRLQTYLIIFVSLTEKGFQRGDNTQHRACVGAVVPHAVAPWPRNAERGPRPECSSSPACPRLGAFVLSGNATMESILTEAAWGDAVVFGLARQVYNVFGLRDTL